MQRNEFLFPFFHWYKIKQNRKERSEWNIRILQCISSWWKRPELHLYIWKTEAEDAFFFRKNFGVVTTLNLIESPDHAPQTATMKKLALARPWWIVSRTFLQETRAFRPDPLFFLIFFSRVMQKFWDSYLLQSFANLSTGKSWECLHFVNEPL